MPKRKHDRDGVFIRRGSYYISFIDAQGRRKQRKLKGVCSKTQAKELRNAELLRAEKARTLGYTEPTKDTVSEFASVYLKHQIKTIEPSSYERTRGIVESHLVPAFGTMRLAAIRRIDAQRYIDSRVGDVSKDTVVKEVNVLKGMLSWAVEKERIPFNPLRGFGKKTGMPQESAGRVRYLDANQLVAVLDECPEWLQPIAGLLVATGMRRSELLRLRWYQVRRAQRQLFLPKTKTHKERYVHLNDLACAVLDRMQAAKPMEFLFSQDVTPNNVSLAFLRACRRAGVVDFRLHDLRHTLASWMRMQNADLQDVAKQLGHADVRMSDRYAQLSSGHMLSAVQRVDMVFAPALSFFPPKALQAQNGTAAGHDEVTMEQENSSKMLQAAASSKQAETVPNSLILTSVA